MPPTRVTSPIKPFINRKPTDKVNRSAKKPKVVPPTIGDSPPTTKPPCHGTGKGLMTTKGPVTEQCPPFLCEDSRYAFLQLSSIIKDDDYEDLGNHATEAMGETDLFSLAQVCDRPLFPSVLFPFAFQLP